jgi:hypothetical protein
MTEYRASTSRPGRARRCKRKRAYASYTVARRVMESHVAAGASADSMNVYPCHGHFHVGHYKKAA